jgi:hypothetical protein
LIAILGKLDQEVEVSVSFKARAGHGPRESTRAA